MNITTFSRLATLVACLAFTGVSPAQIIPRNTGQLEYREFTSADGKKVEAILVDKTEDTLTLRLKNGKTTTLPLDKISDADKEYVREWDKAKDIFVNQCKSLRIGSLLELRGYESFKFTLEGNHIFVKGEMNGKPAKFMIDTGAGSTTLDIIKAKEKDCEVGPLDQTIFGIAGDAPAAITKVKQIKLGESVVEDLELLSTDLWAQQPGARRTHDGILGANLMSQLRAVISYKEGRIFLRPDLVDVEDDAVTPEPPKYRLFKTKDGKVRPARIKKKNATSTELNLVDREGNVRSTVTLPNGNFVAEDQDYITKWSPQRDLFLRQCRDLTVQDLLELRQYQSFEYKRKGNHIFVDGKLNGNETLFMIDTGAGSTVLHSETAEKTDCDVGVFDQWVYGIGGKAPAAITGVKMLEMGRAKFENRKLIAVDMFKRQKEMGFPVGDYGAIFGADFMRETEAVITYREQKVFLDPQG